jgi:hypothetical protein
MPATCEAWGRPDFASTFKREFEGIDPAWLPLQAGLAYSSAVADEPFHAILIATHANDSVLVLKVGVMYAGIIAGCNCADDPTPITPLPEYCVLEVRIDRTSTAVITTLLSDD